MKTELARTIFIDKAVADARVPGLTSPLFRLVTELARDLLTTRTVDPGSFRVQIESCTAYADDRTEIPSYRVSAFAQIETPDHS